MEGIYHRVFNVVFSSYARFLTENLREEQIIAHQTESVMAQLYHELQKDTASLHRIDVMHNKQDTATIVLENYILNTNLEDNKVNFFIYITFYLLGKAYLKQVVLHLIN